MKNGIYNNLTYEEYDKIDALRSSDIKTFAKNPRTLWLEKNGYLKKEKTESMEFGNLFHEAILEPELYSKRQIFDSFATKEAKIIPDHLKIRSKHHYEINLMKMMFELQEHRFKNYIDNSIKEITIVSDGKKAKIDFLTILNNDTLIIGDLKTHSKEDTRKLSYEISDRNYIIQMVYYKLIFEEIIEKIKQNEIISIIPQLLNITKIKTMLIFCDKNAPYTPCELNIPEYMIDNATVRLKNILEDIEEQKKKHNGFEKMWDDTNPNKFNEQDLMNIF